MYFYTVLFLTAALASSTMADLLVPSVVATTTLTYLTPTVTPTLTIYPTWSKNYTSMTYPGTGMTSIYTRMNHTMTMSHNTTRSNNTSTKTQTSNTTVTRTICDEQSRCSVTVSVGPTVVITETGTGVMQPTMTPFTSGIGRVVAGSGWIVVILCGLMLLM
ncbi:uncharacterized protein H6S33_006185 [Morchella sextelata]|uniref:uncharacterized protein n=1 Tax=Morchella sextelata TaxID=1174677 RepID=UPI001D04B00E|nr:uncharacterized protein H6S33_006185 [Morchella sextelata]KAH0614299.1 hypothetical protein H6S33_006185 [Morchella sextelata]